MNQFSSITKIGITAVILLVLAFVAFPLAIVGALIGIPLMVYWAWFGPNPAFPRKPWL
jgi:uncharacterized YccA/Bax inhibitor family protein